MVFDLNALHVLPADIQDAVHFRVKESGGIVVGYRFHLSIVKKKGGFHQRFAVAGGAGARDFYTCREQMIDLL